MMMSITLQEFFVGQTVYAQNTFGKPQIDNIPPTVVEIDAGLPSDNIKKPLLTDTSQELIEPIASDQSSQNIQQNEQCAKNIPGSLWKDGQCSCKNGMSSDKMECLKDCSNGYVEKNGKPINECLENGTDNLGINCKSTQLINGTCSRNINKTLGIRSSNSTPNPTLLLQDVVLAATSFVGTMIMIALVVMGIKYVKGGYDESSTGDLKGNIKKLLIGLFLIIGSYTIIRLIQYVARGY